jgi:hypothetical protein
MRYPVGRSRTFAVIKGCWRRNDWHHFQCITSIGRFPSSYFNLLALYLPRVFINALQLLNVNSLTGSIQSSIATFYSFCGCVGKLSNINIYHLQLKIYLFRTVGTYGGSECSECKPNAVCGL